MKIKELHEKLKEFLEIRDTKLIDTILAVAISREQKHMKLWIIIIGRSGNGKTELIRLLDDEGKTSKIIRSFTSRTLVNGHEERKKKDFPDLAPKLKDKVILLPEMACILTTNKDEKANIWAQLRDLYDGVAGKQSGNGIDVDYTDLNVTFIGCSTPEIDKQVLIHQSLGTRELLYRCEENDDERLMNKIVENSLINKDEKRKELKGVIQDFIKSREYKNIEISKETEDKIRNWATLTTMLRASADIDYNTGELISFMYPEAPSRILEQLIVFFRALKSLDEDYTDEEALEVIRKIVLSSCDPIRLEVLINLIKNNVFANERGFSYREIAKNVDISPKKAFCELNILSSKRLGLTKKAVTIDEDRDKSFYRFRINEENEIVKKLAKELGLNENLGLEIIEERIK